MATKKTVKKVANKKTLRKKSDKKVEKKPEKKSDMPFHRFIGVSLAGGKTKKTSLSVLDYFSTHEKIFLSHVFPRMGEEKGLSSDDVLLGKLNELQGKKTHIAFDVPLSLPKCTTCKLSCPGIQSCKVKEIFWMRDHHNKRDKKKRPNKFFTPYTERCVETFLLDGLEEPFYLSHSLGANAAPLTARAHFLQKRIKTTVSEVAPKISVWRIGRSMKIAKSHLRFHSHATRGEESRSVFMNAMIEKKKAFIYQQDLKVLTENCGAFDSFIVALTAYLEFQGECEFRPKGFPKTAAWIDFPSESIKW